MNSSLGYKLRCVKVKVVIGFSIWKNRSMLICGKYCWCDSWLIKNICIFQHNKWFSVMLLLQVMIAHRDVIEARSPFLRVKNLGSWKLKERKEDWGKEEWLFDILEQSIIWPVWIDIYYQGSIVKSQLWSLHLALWKET